MLIASTMNLALLHAGGWDEMLMVGAGLVIAWLIITWTGRSRDDADDEDDDLGDSPVAPEEGKDSDREAARRPTERRDDE